MAIVLSSGHFANRPLRECTLREHILRERTLCEPTISRTHTLRTNTSRTDTLWRDRILLFLFLQKSVKKFFTSKLPNTHIKMFLITPGFQNIFFTIFRWFCTLQNESCKSWIWRSLHCDFASGFASQSLPLIWGPSAECWVVKYVGDLTKRVEDLVTSGGTRQLVEEELLWRNGISEAWDGFLFASDIDNSRDDSEQLHSGVMLWAADAMSLILEPFRLIVKSLEPSRLLLKVVEPQGLWNSSFSSSRVFNLSIKWSGVVCG